MKAAVLQQTLAELQRNGYGGFNASQVAKNAGVHETTIYRRWKTKEQLIFDACMSFAEQQMPAPDTGSLESDLKAALENLVALINTPIGQALVALAFAARTIPDFAASALSFWKLRIALGQRIFGQAAARGEWPAGYDENSMFTELVGPMFARYFLLQQEITPQLISAIVAKVVALSRDHVAATKAASLRSRKPTK